MRFHFRDSRALSLQGALILVTPPHSEYTPVLRQAEMRSPSVTQTTVNPPISNSTVPPSTTTEGPDKESASSLRWIGWLSRPVRLVDCLGARQFITRITLQKFAANVLVALPLSLLGSGKHHPVVDTDFSIPHNFWRAALAVAVIAPIFETLLLQTAPIEIARAIRLPRMVQFLMGAIPFAALHFPMGIKMGIGAGIVGGLFLSHAYLEARNCSVGSAVWITMMIHLIQNLIFMSCLLLAVWAGAL